MKGSSVGQIRVQDHDLQVVRLMATAGQRREPITYWVTLGHSASIPGVSRKLAQLKYGLQGWIMDADKMTNVVAKQDIPIGHKVALKDMSTGDTVVKYGIDMGKVVAPIRAGEHAHVHNIKTKRW